MSFQGSRWHKTGNSRGPVRHIPFISNVNLVAGAGGGDEIARTEGEEGALLQV